MEKEQLLEISKIVSKYYRQPKLKKIPPSKQKFKEKIIVQEPEITIEKVKKGPKPIAYFILLAGIAAGVILLGLNTSLALIVMILSFVIGVITAIFNRQVEDVEIERMVEVEKIIEKEKVVGEERIEEIPNNERITGIYKGNIPFSAIPFKDKSILISNINIGKDYILRFPTLENYNRVYEINSTMDELAESIPYILDGEKQIYESKERSSYGEDVVLRGYEMNLYENISNMGKECKKAHDVDLSFSTINSKLIESELINRNEDFESDMLSNYINSKEGFKLDQLLKEWINKWDINSDVLGAVRFDSLSDQVSAVNFELENVINYSAFNFYCPVCNMEEAKEFLDRDYSLQNDFVNDPLYFSDTTQCTYNQNNSKWVCKTCNKEFDKPIPVHKSFDEILLPSYIRLMDENKNDRLKVHKETKDREIELDNNMEAEIEKISYDNMSAIYELRDGMERMKSEIAGEAEAIESFRDIIKLYSDKQSNVLNNISEYAQNVNLEVAKRTDEVLAKIDQIKESEMTQLTRKLTQFAVAKKKEEEARDAVQKSILTNSIRMIEATERGFEKVNQNLSSINTSVQEGNKITRDGFVNVNKTLETGNEITKQGFQEVNSSINEGTKSIANQISTGNAISASVAKKQGINLHDEAIWRLDKKLKKWGVEIGGTLSGASTVEKEGEKFNG